MNSYNMGVDPAYLVMFLKFGAFVFGWLIGDLLSRIFK
jgi:hypothetical protein